MKSPPTGVQSKIARAVADFRDFDPIERELCELPRIGARLVRWTDADYPASLREIADPPPYFFVRGSSPPPISQDASPWSERAPPAMPAAGWRIGSASNSPPRASPWSAASPAGSTPRPIRARLTRGGHTIAVMGCGIDVIYPPENRKLAEAIVAGGGRYRQRTSGWDASRSPENFPTRNRLISGLCLGVVIVEAAEKAAR